MPYRYFRRLDTGELCAGLVGSEGPFGTPMVAHRQNWADGQGVPLDQIEGVEVARLQDVPDLTTARPPLPVPPLPGDLEREAARQLTLPTFAEIDTIVDTIFSGLTAAQRTYLKRLSKLVRRLAERHGL